MKQTINMNPSQTALWEKIHAFPLDVPGAAIPFSRKLAGKQGWSPAFTQGAIAEYKKFIFLCCISPHGAAPSQIIDEVWHLHLLYTQSYWEDFCGGVLGRSLHHHPSQGGVPEQARHERWRADTLVLYRNTFNTEPSPAYWNDHTQKPQGKYRRMMRQLACWLLPIPLLLLSGCGPARLGIPFLGFFLFFFLTKIGDWLLVDISQQKKASGDKKGNNSCSGGSSSCSGGGNSCGSSCGSSCGGGCGGCGGGS